MRLYKDGARPGRAWCRARRFGACAMGIMVSVSGTWAAYVPVEGPIQVAPPPFPPVLTRAEEPIRERPRPQDNGKSLYSIGQPTGEEQLYLELINRARADPAAEGERLRATTDPEVLSAYSTFNVDLQLMVDEFAAINPAPPLAMDAQLMAAARLHTEDMFANQFQGHSGSDGSTLEQRVTAQGYPWASIAENVYAYALSVWHGHAGFNVDWGVGGAGGMQLGRGHRVNIHNDNYREIGIGVVLGRNGGVGPQLVTQDFAARQGATPLLTGVVYYDLNGNDFYDVGEGIGGVTVSVDESLFYAVTADTGGYAVPVPGDGNYSVTFTATGLSDQEEMAEVTGLRNQKIDHRPIYSPPVVAGPDPALLGVDNLYTFTPVGGAVAHQIEQATLVEYVRVEGAEDGLDHVTVDVSPGYEVVTDSIRASGTYSFHLVHPEPPTDQVLTLNVVLRPADSSQLTFQSRLGWASVNQVARVQVTTDGGFEWGDLWTQAGTDGAGESGFQPQSVPLDAYAGETLLVRFVYDYVSGGYFPQTDIGVGWHIDDIAISNAGQLLNPVVTDVVSGDSFTFAPATMDDHLLRVRGKLSGERLLPWGPAKLIAVSDAVPISVRIAGAPTIDDGAVTIRFALESGTAAVFEIHDADEIEGAWSPVGGVIISALGDGQFEAEFPLPTGKQRFYRVVVP